MRAIFTEKSRTRDFIQHSSLYGSNETHIIIRNLKMKSESTEILEIS